MKQLGKMDLAYDEREIKEGSGSYKLYSEPINGSAKIG